MVLAVLLLLVPGGVDDTMEALLKALRSDDPDVRANATADILASWPLWNEEDLTKLEDAARDEDPEVSGRAGEARVRIRIRRSLGKTLFQRIPRADDAFLKGDDAAKLAVLGEAKVLWKKQKLTKDDMAGLESLVLRAPWTDPANLDRFLKDPDAQLVFSVPGDSEARVRVKTKEVELLGMEGRKRTGQVAEYLADGEPEVRATALRVMGGLQAREQAPKVSVLLRDRNASVRGEALALLTTWGAKEYAADFSLLLDDPNGRVRWRAAEALGSCGHKDAGPRIAKLLKDPFAPTRAEAAMVLGTFGAREFTSDLAPLLADAVPMVRRSAAYAIGKFGAAEYAPQLRKLLKDPDPGTRLTAAQSLGQLGADVQFGDVVDLIRDADPDVRDEAAWVLGLTASKDWAKRIALLIESSDAQVRHHAVWALGLMRARDARTAVTAMLSDSSSWVRSEAVLTLARIGEKEDLPKIAALLRDPDRKVRVNAALALGELGSADAEDALAALQRDPDRLLGLSSTLSLARLGQCSPAALRLALQEIATDDLAFACLGMAASDAASAAHSREAWELLDRPLRLKRSIETWADLSAALLDAGLTLDVQTDGMIGRLDRSHSLTGRDALAWLLGRYATPTMVLDGKKVRLVDRREGLAHWQKRLEGK